MGSLDLIFEAALRRLLVDLTCSSIFVIFPVLSIVGLSLLFLGRVKRFGGRLFSHVVEGGDLGVPCPQVGLLSGHFMFLFTFFLAFRTVGGGAERCSSCAPGSCRGLIFDL